MKLQIDKSLSLRGQFKQIMEQVSPIVWKAMCESVYGIDPDEFEDIFEIEGDENGVIQVTTSAFVPRTGNREIMDTEWQIIKLEDLDDTYEVRATVVSTENPALPVDYYIDFEIDKNANYVELEDTLKYEVSRD